MNSIMTSVCICTGLSIFREKYGSWIRPTRESTFADDRIKQVQRVMTVFQILTVLSFSYSRPPNAQLFSRDWTGWSFSIACFSGISAQLLMEIMLAVSAQMLVMYDTERDRGNDVGDALKNLRKELNELQKTIYVTQDALVKERMKATTLKSEKEQCERKINNDKYLINMLYERIETFSEREKEKEKEKKEFLTELREKIEDNTDGFNEGDYLTMMELLKKLYE